MQIPEQLRDAVGRAGAERGRDGAAAGVVAAAAVAAQRAGAGGRVATLLAVRAGQQKCFPAAAPPAQSLELSDAPPHCRPRPVETCVVLSQLYGHLSDKLFH